MNISVSVILLARFLYTNYHRWLRLKDAKGYKRFFIDYCVLEFSSVLIQFAGQLYADKSLMLHALHSFDLYK